MNDKVREIRLRRAARRWNLRLKKSRTRSRYAVDYGLYALIQRNDGAPLASVDRDFYELSLDQVEQRLIV
jgi:predicted nucleic acid-binding protein